MENIRKERLQYVQVGSCKFLLAVNPAETSHLHITISLEETEEGLLKLLAEGTANETCFIKLKAICCPL